ncbi:VOC family protein [Natronorarus salvus]|uniref:VOC family protein n=1 Tax=Natronorarus salvus TaxID=3117733 RepID=UPI002F25F099
MNPQGIDHLVLTVADPERTCAFYERAVGAERVEFDGRVALRIGEQKVNLHVAGDEYDPHADEPVPGSGDFCVLVSTPIEEVRVHLDEVGIEVIHGPAEKVGTHGPLRSVYVRDPDGNLVELAEPQY